MSKNREGDMAEEKKEQWLNYLAVTTVILAVSATLSTFYGQRYSTRSVVNEIKASNQWNWYQSKRIRAYMVEGQKDSIQTSMATIDSKAQPATAETLQKRIDEKNRKLKEWEGELTGITADAKKFETVREDSIKHANAFGLAVIFLQLAILLSSIAALMKKKAVWLVGLVVGVIGIVLFADGFFMGLESARVKLFGAG
jgi:hypothetical protein